MIAKAYVNWGRWVAACPRDGCTSAMELQLGQQIFHCDGMDSCGAVADVEWPLDAAEITAMLSLRLLPRTRNWVPGETLTDLLAESLEHGVI